MNCFYDPLSVRHVLTSFTLGHARNEIIISALPILVKAGKDSREFLRECTRMDKFFIEPPQNLGVT